MNKLKVSFIAATAAFSIIAFGTANAESIKIPTHNWSSQLVGAEIVGKLFEMIGSEVEYIPIDSQTVYQSMCENDIDIVHEVWQGAFGAAFEKVVGEGCVIDLATHDAKTREEWWYPKHVKEMCPELPDWKALDSCSEMFARVDSDGKGVFIGGPVDWLKNDAEKVEALGMNFVVKNAGSAAAIWAELEAGIKQNKPVVIFNWTPNFIEALYEGEFVEFPAYSPECYKDPAWGMNEEALYDCGSPTGGYLKIGVSHGFKENHSKAYEVASKINFTNLDVAKQSNYVDTEGMEVEAAANRWLEEHKDKWQVWIQ